MKLNVSIETNSHINRLQPQATDIRTIFFELKININFMYHTVAVIVICDAAASALPEIIKCKLFNE
jgi:hypothetical protein